MIGIGDLSDQERQGHVLRLHGPVDEMQTQDEAVIACEKLKGLRFRVGQAEVQPDALRVDSVTRIAEIIRALEVHPC